MITLDILKKQNELQANRIRVLRKALMKLVIEKDQYKNNQCICSIKRILQGKKKI